MFDLDDLFYNIMIKLDWKTLNRFSQTCKQFYNKDKINIIREIVHKKSNGLIVSLYDYDILKRIYCLTDKTIYDCGYIIGYLSNSDKIVGSYQHYLKLKDGKIYVSGTNNFGQLGMSNPRIVTETTLDIYNIIDIATSHNLSAALRNDGKVYIFGMMYVNKYPPTIINELNNIVQISMNKHLFALRNDGKVLKYGYSIKTPLIINGLNNIVQIFCGNVLLALDNNGKVYKYNDTSIEMLDLNNIISIFCYFDDCYVIDINGNVYDCNEPRLLFQSDNINEVGVYGNNICFKVNNNVVF